MEKMNDLRDLLKHEIEDLYSAEEQIIEALPKMMGKATNKNLKSALAQHLDVTERQKKRLDEVQQLMNDGSEENNGKKKGFLSGLLGGGKHTCKAMQGIIEEGNKVLGEDMTTKVRDAAIIACAQKVEHYEICGYGTARTYAWELGLEKVARLLEQTLNEEYEADDKLTALAVNKINQEAEAGSSKGNRPGSEMPGRGSRERVKSEEMELEAVSDRSRSSSKGASQKRNDSPKGSSRTAGTGRSSASSKTSSAGSRKTSGGTNGRTSSRSGNSSGRSSKGR